MSRKNKKQSRKWHIGLIARFNAFFALLLLISYLAYYIPPDPVWPLGLFGLAYPIFLTINTGFLIFWIILKKKYLFVSLISILLGWNHVGNHFRLFPAKEKESARQISVMTYNVRLSRITETGRKPAEFSSWLRQHQSDITCFQESYYPAKGQAKSLSGIAPRQRLSAYHRKAGLAILSTLPSFNKGEIDTRGRVFSVYADFISGDDTLRVYNTQLASNYLDDEKLIFDAGTEMQQQELQRQASNLVRKLINGYQRRVREVKALKRHINQSPYPVILCGDLNNTPLSYTYHHLRGSRFSDSFHNQQSIGMGNTYNGKMPPIRIDYVLHDKEYKTLRYERIKVDFSDHYPVKVSLSLPNEQ